MRTPAQNGEKMRTYLVTGGAGFIGSNYIHYMFKNTITRSVSLMWMP